MWHDKCANTNHTRPTVCPWKLFGRPFNRSCVWWECQSTLRLGTRLVAGLDCTSNGPWTAYPLWHVPPPRSKAAPPDPEHAPAPVIPVIAQPGLAGLDYGCNASFDNCCTPGSSICSRIFSFPAHTDTVRVCVCVQVRKVMTATHAGLLLEECFFFFLSLLISTFFGNFPLLSFLLSCRLSSPEVTKNALKTGSRVANTHPSLTPTQTQTLSYPSRHSVSRSSHKSFAEIKAQVSSRLKFHFNSLLIVIWEGERVRHTHTHMGTISLSSSSILHVRRSPAANEAFDRARTRSHSHTHAHTYKQHVAHSHMAAFTLSWTQRNETANGPSECHGEKSLNAASCACCSPVH